MIMPTKYKGTAKERRALSTFICVKRACESIDARINRSVKLENITPSQFSILECLYHLGPLKPGELAQKMLMSCGNVTYVLDRLVEKNFVSRKVNSGDRRSFVIGLEDKGEQMVKDHLPAYVKDISALMSILSPEEQNSLRDLTKKLGLGIMAL
jgi:MarR family transcriptional regulator, 2-MHQ and catechol-resistance regulon repressor